jgi:integrase
MFGRMASVKRRRDSKYWVACITLPDGKQKQFSTGLTDQDEALAAATAAERAARKHQHAPHKLRGALERIAEDYVPANEADPAGWLPAWAMDRAAEVSAATLAAYKSTMKEAAEFCRRESIRSFSALTPRRVVELRDWWAGRNSARTVNSKVKLLRIALRAARRAKLLEENPAEEVAAVRVTATPRREFRPAELEVLLPTLSGEWLAITLLGLYTGQRLNDLAELKWLNLDLAAATITFTARKTGALVALPLLQPAVDALAALPAVDDPAAAVFPRIVGMARTSRSNAFRDLLASCGLAQSIDRRKQGPRPARRETQPLSFHSLRHSATSMLKAAGVSDAIARAIIGHESAAVSRQYTHLDMSTMRQAMEKMPSL